MQHAEMDMQYYTRFVLAVHPLAPDYTANARVLCGEFFHEYFETGVEGITTFVPNSGYVAIFNHEYKQIASFVLAPRYCVRFRVPDLVVFDQPSFSVCLQFCVGAHAETFAQCVNKLQSARVRCKGIVCCDSYTEVEADFAESTTEFQLLPRYQVEIDRLAYYFRVSCDFRSVCRAQRDLIYSCLTHKLREPPHVHHSGVRAGFDNSSVGNLQALQQKSALRPKTPPRDTQRSRSLLEKSGLQFQTSESENKASPIVVDRFRSNLRYLDNVAGIDTAIRRNNELFRQEGAPRDLQFI